MSEPPRTPARLDPLPVLERARVWLAPVPPQRRLRTALGLIAVLGLIGWLDYSAGFWVSLQLFYLGPIVLSVAWLGWRVGCLVATLSVTLRLAGDTAAGIFQYISVGTVFWNRLAEIAISFTLVFAVHALFLLQRELEERIRRRTASLEQAIAARNQLQRELFETSRRERSAIGHDLHDGLGQHLTATSMAATLLANRLAAAGQPTSADAQAIVRLLQDAIDKTRHIARGLLLSAIEPNDLAPELEEFAGKLRQEHGVPCFFTFRGQIKDISVAASSQIYYIAQEAALNAVRHARATRVEISLVGDDRALTLTVSDDGAGLPAEAESSLGMGLRIMRHRAELIGAHFELESHPAAGTRVRCHRPLPTTASPFPTHERS